MLDSAHIAAARRGQIGRGGTTVEPGAALA